MNIQDDIKQQENIRRRFFSIYLLPMVVLILFSVTSYFLTDYFNLDVADTLFTYLISIGIGLFLHLKNRFKWFPMPDGSYIQLDDLRDNSIPELDSKKSQMSEPSTYVAEFPYMVSIKIISIIIGLLLIGMGIFIISKSSIIMPTILISGGIFLVYSGYNDLNDTEAKLKLAKTGLWTKELGFVPWSSIKKTTIKIDKGIRFSTTYLEIYLRENDINFPDQRLSINDLKDNEKIKSLLDELCNQASYDR